MSNPFDQVRNLLAKLQPVKKVAPVTQPQPSFITKLLQTPVAKKLEALGNNPIVKNLSLQENARRGLDLYQGITRGSQPWNPQAIYTNPSQAPTKPSLSYKIGETANRVISPFVEAQMQFGNIPMPQADFILNKVLTRARGAIPKSETVAKTVGSKLPEFKYNPLEKLDNLPPLRTPAKTGNYTNVREIDNPLAGGKEFMDVLRKHLTEVVPEGDTTLAKKINVFDKFLRTPDRVLEKIGLKPEMNFLRTQWDRYQAELPQEINRITAWSKRVPEGSNKQIFNYLDGKDVVLHGEDKIVADEIKGYLKTWAQKLNLPPEKRISDYITHIFEKGTIQKEFDQDIAKIIDTKVAGSVYDPFLQARKGHPEYIQDTWRALDAYVKRATRKYNLDPALKNIEKASENFELGQYNYVKDYVARVNMQPTEIDNIIDNTIKQVGGYRFGQRPTAALTQKARQMVYRGSLGLNPATALKNLTQGANTYAKLGERYTLTGYADLVKSIMTKSKELEEVGVLKNSFIEDRTVNATRKFWEKLDKGLFYMFETAEKINRGSAYFGAKAKALAEGKTEQEAIAYGKKIVADTQFLFGSIDTPPILQSDIGKTLLQFQSYSLKQAEFLGEMVQKKEYAGLLRYGLANLVILSTVGKSLGMDLKDMMPSFRIGVPPTLQLPASIAGAVANVPDKYGNVPDTSKKIQNVVGSAVPLIPGGTQLKKSIQGLQAYNEGASLTPTGKEKFPVEQTPSNLIRSLLFGQYGTQEGRSYVENLGVSKSEQLYKDLKRLSPEQAAATVKQLKTQNPSAYRSFNEYMSDRQMKITTEEKNLRNLSVQDGNRARALVKMFNSQDTPQAKAEMYKRLKQLGVITALIEKQLNAARQAGALK